MAHGDRSVDVFVRKLRQKLEKRSPSWSYIHTHFGIGYRFDPDPAGIVEEELRPAEPLNGQSSSAEAEEQRDSASPEAHKSFTAK
jgi:DNA-binding winged helix-turn-helix (wHTH) protein